MARHLLRPAARAAMRQHKGQNAAIPMLTLTATTTAPGETVTIDRMTPAAGKTLTIAWGDGNSTVVNAGDTAAKSNVYAAAGTYSIAVTLATDIVQINLHDSKLSGFQSSQLAASAINYFTCYSLGAAVASVIDSADMAAWTPSYWWLSSMPAGTYAIDSADMAAWTPRNWWLYSMPAGTTFTLDAAHFAGFTRCGVFRADANGWSQAQVNAVLWGLYQATLNRTVTGGTIQMDGTNAAPSGTFQAAAICSVTAATPGKEVAHELLNDGCGAIAAGETWATVAVTA
jgi:hypothetical protein